MNATHSTFGTSEEKALRAAADLVRRAGRSQEMGDHAWDKAQWDSFRDDLVLFSLYELPVLLRMAEAVS